MNLLDELARLMAAMEASKADRDADLKASRQRQATLKWKRSHPDKVKAQKERYRAKKKAADGR